ncbi:LuxR family transcriptional regulator [Nocardia mangyaensis]|uniref:LuxR family transcriptional regulator n=2 Tax=Nocardia mangyaensis TaxID=2213200 RepID=A0A1J0VV69_9NOCA|nr:LuxR family transcriptional regulator [Nocardia mangyaensis]
MSIALQRFSNMIAAIYSAGTDADRWDGVIHEITEAFGAVHGILVIAEPATDRFAVKTAGHDAPTPITVHLSRVAELVHHLPTGLAATSDDLFAAREQCGAPADRASANGLANSFLVRLSDDVPCSFLCLTMADHAAIAGHSVGLALLRVLVPHLHRALCSRSELIELSQERAMALATLEQTPYGIMIITADAALVFANSMATDITSRADGLAVDAFGYLHAAPTTTHHRLRRLIESAASSERVSGNVAVPRASGGRPLIVRITSLDGDAGTGPWQRSALALVIDPEHDPDPDPAVLHEVYGLTEAETTVAMAVLRGDGLPAVADQLSVSVYTARTHLQHIFAKTHTHRQAELVRLLLTSAVAAP